MLELIFPVDWALIMHEEKENHLEQEVFPNGQNEPSLLFSQDAQLSPGTFKSSNRL